MNDDLTDPVPTGPGTDPREYLAIMLKHVWAMILVVVAFGAGGYYYASNQAEVYEATSRIVIDTSSPQILSDVAPVVETGGQSYWAIREYMETQHRIIGSTSVAGEVASRLGLDNDPAFLGLGAVEDPVELERELERADAGLAVQDRVRVEPEEDSHVVAIHARAGDPATAAAIANTTAEVYIERNIARKLESTDAAAEWLETQYSDLLDALTRSESALVDFRQRHDLIAVELAEHVSLTSRMEETSRQLADARLESDRARTVVEQIDAALEEGTLLEADIPAVVENELIQSLKAELYEIEAERIELSARYLGEHPLMVSVVEREELAAARLDREIRNVLGSYRQSAARADNVVRTLEQRLRDVESEVQQLGTHQVEYAALLREAEANRELFDLIERRLKEVELTRNSQHNNVELLEAAVTPQTPVEPNEPVIIAAALGAGLFFAVILAFLLEAMDSTIKNQESVERQFGLTFLGIIPQVKPTRSARSSKRGPSRGEAWSPSTYVHQYPKSAVAESCRSIRTNLTFLASEEPLDTLLITSPGPREGKTTTSMNIATAIAQSGTRVLLVDADMRRPRVHTIWDSPNEIGLSTVLLEKLPAVDAIQTTPVQNMDVLTSGPVPTNPAELIESSRFREVVAELSSMYDRVIFDSPPVTPVTDAAILSSLVDGVVLVIRANTTRKEILGRAVDLLGAVNSNIIGGILNDVDLTRRRSGSYYYYYYQYSQYYGRDEESDAA